MNRVARVVRDSALELILFNGIGVGISVVGFFFVGGSLLPIFGFVVLIESVALMLIGGAMDLSTTGSIRIAMRQLKMVFGSRSEGEEELTPDQKRKIGTTAATYAITGVLLFLEAALLTLAYV